MRIVVVSAAAMLSLTSISLTQARSESTVVHCASRASASTHLFATADLRSDEARSLACGTKLEVIGRAYSNGRDSIRVRTQDGTEGYVLPEVVGESTSAGSEPEVTHRPKSHDQYAGIFVSWDDVAKPNRLAGALRGAMLGAAMTPAPPAEPSDAGCGVSRGAQGAIAAGQAGEQMPYPTRSIIVYTFHSGYYLISASMKSAEHPVMRVGDVVRFRVRRNNLYLTDATGEGFKLRVVSLEHAASPYTPSQEAGQPYNR